MRLTASSLLLLPSLFPFPGSEKKSQAKVQWYMTITA